VERWHTNELSWAVRQPPIEGGGNRIYLAGDGLAAIDGGSIVWEKQSDVPMFATAFSDGSLVVAQHARLLFIDRDGKERASLETPDHETLVTPPAPSSDGSIWVASAEHLYVAR